MVESGELFELPNSDEMMRCIVNINSDLVHTFSDVKRGQFLEAEAEDKSSRPRPRTNLRGRGRGQNHEAEAEDNFSESKDNL